MGRLGLHGRGQKVITDGRMGEGHTIVTDWCEKIYVA